MHNVVTVHALEVVRGRVTILRNFNLTVRAGEAVALMGPSGTGKTSVLHCIAGLLSPHSGAVTVGEHDMARRSVAARADARRLSIGQVFQQPELLPELTVLENVALPLLLDGMRAAPAQERAASLLHEIGLGGKEHRMVDEVSGGEAQRAAIARALARDSVAVVLADEPTASLDQKNAAMVTDALLAQCRTQSKALLVATHDPLVAEKCDRTVHLVAP
ncbi:ATP-binding cassette domain-containing protein [Micrococcales bacterium 31B]|nr:ATP-binding cassette domain-containing protein [Micrococcales bacterium 31B]